MKVEIFQNGQGNWHAILRTERFAWHSKPHLAPYQLLDQLEGMLSVLLDMEKTGTFITGDTES